MRYFIALLASLVVSTSALAAGYVSPQELFRIADTDPSYEELVVAVTVEPTQGNIQAFKIFSGRDLLYTRDVTQFAPGGVIQKYFLTIQNESFYPDRGGRLIVKLGSQSLPVDILRSGNGWIAQSNEKRIRKVSCKVRRFMGIPVGIDERTPIKVDKMLLWDFLR